MEAGREASPSRGMIGSQSLKTTEGGARAGLDPGKKIKDGSIILSRMHRAFSSVQSFTPPIIEGRDGATNVLACIRQSFPWLRHVFANGGRLRPDPVVPVLVGKCPVSPKAVDHAGRSG